jgi:hypothetical protein
MRFAKSQVLWVACANDMRLKVAGWFAFFLATILTCAGTAYATDISGTIAKTLTIMDNSRLVGDVTCTVTGAPCIAFGAPGLTLDLNGYHLTGLADVTVTCSGGPTALTPGATEDGIDLGAQAVNATVLGPGIVQMFRGPGIWALMADSLTVTGVTVANNCASGILVGGGSNHNISNNVSVRNGSRTFACGGI